MIHSSGHESNVLVGVIVYRCAPLLRDLTYSVHCLLILLAYSLKPLQYFGTHLGAVIEYHRTPVLHCSLHCINLTFQFFKESSTVSYPFADFF